MSTKVCVEIRRGELPVDIMHIESGEYVELAFTWPILREEFLPKDKRPMWDISKERVTTADYLIDGGKLYDDRGNLLEGTGILHLFLRFGRYTSCDVYLNLDKGSIVKDSIDMRVERYDTDDDPRKIYNVLIELIRAGQNPEAHEKMQAIVRKHCR